MTLPKRTRKRHSENNPHSKRIVREIYRRLSTAWGPQHWWPATTEFEVIVGAILTQNTSWRNVELALNNLRLAGLLNIEGVRAVSESKLQMLIRSSGYFRQKAKRLKDFVSFLDSKYSGSLKAMFAQSTEKLRAELLTQKGIGHETADSILLYAGNHEIFVVDAYTRRILERHAVIAERAKYDEIREHVEAELERSLPDTRGATEIAVSAPPSHPPSAMSARERSSKAQTYNELHGLIVQVGKHYCLKRFPRCETCPLRDLLPPGGPAVPSVVKT